MDNKGLVVASSWVAIPVCSRIVKRVAYFREDALITLYMFSVVGIRGIFLSYLYFGFWNVRLFVLQKFW